MKKNGLQMRKELAQAHLIIAMLAASIIALLAINTSAIIEFQPILSAICVILLIAVIIISLCTAFTLLSSKRR